MQQGPRTRQISARKLTILLLLAQPDSTGEERASIIGTTRMQKMVFLSMKRSGEFLRDDEAFRFDFAFDADRFGPADLELYQDLELLKLTGWISIDGGSNRISGTRIGETSERYRPLPPSSAEVTLESLLGEEQEGSPMLPEDNEESELSFDYLMGDEAEEVAYAETEEQSERVYTITDHGMEGLNRIRLSSTKQRKFDQLAEVCREVKHDYASWPLNALLRYVYTQYPETTVKSEIKGRVLRY